MLVGETVALRETISAEEAFTVDLRTVTIYDSAGEVVETGTPALAGESTETQILSWPFEATAAGVFRALFEYGVESEVRRREQRFVVEAAPTTGFPAASDLQRYLLSLSILGDTDALTVLDRMNLEAKCAAAARQWEQDTGWKPFLKDMADTTRRLTPTGRALQYLPSGLLELTSLTTGVTTDSAGTLLTDGDDFWLGPTGADAQNRPFEWIEFPGSYGGSPRSLVIVGKWGYSADCPADVWQAVLFQAALLSYPELSLNLSGGLASVQTQSTTTRFSGNGALFPEANLWRDEYRRTVRAYKRVTC